MPTDLERMTTNPFDAYKAGIERHGYGFQFAVLAEAKRLRDGDKKTSRWQPRAAEFPVESRGASTRVDLVFQHSQTPAYLLVECKRANPALANWCFARAPFTAHGTSVNAIVADVLQLYREGVHSRGEVLGEHPHYHVAFEAATGIKGDATGNPKGAIEEAVTQVLRGTAGFASFLRTYHALLKMGEPLFLLPVVCTTARLFVSDVDLQATNLLTGVPTLEPASVRPVKWLLYQYQASPTIRHDIPTGRPSDVTLASLMQYLYTRTVAVVSPEGLEEFLVAASSFRIQAAS